MLRYLQICCFSPCLYQNMHFHANQDDNFVIGGFMKLSCGDIANDDNEIYEYKILHITFAVKNEFPF